MADVPTTCFVKAQYSEHLDFMQSHSLVNKAHLSITQLNTFFFSIYLCTYILMPKYVCACTGSHLFKRHWVLLSKLPGESGNTTLFGEPADPEDGK